MFAPSPKGPAYDIFAELKAGGEEAILDWLRRSVAEHSFIDFKRVGPGGKGDIDAMATRLGESDAKNFGRTLSGFANTLGGVAVWGIECIDKEHPRTRAITPGIGHPTQFEGLLQRLVSGSTVPGLYDTEFHTVPLPSLGPNRGAVLMYVPRRPYGPVMVNIGEEAGKFIFRAEDGFQRVTYDMLAAMFGRTPPPSMRSTVFCVCDEPAFVADALRLRFTAGLWNEGGGMARHPFLDFRMESPLSGFVHQFPHGGADSRFAFLGSVPGEFTVVGRQEFPLPPGSRAIVANTHFDIVRPPYDRPLRLLITVGSELSLPRTEVLEAHPDLVATVFQRAQVGMTQAQVWRALFLGE